MPLERVILVEKTLSQEPIYVENALQVRTHQQHPLPNVIDAVRRAGRQLDIDRTRTLTIMAHGLETQHLNDAQFMKEVAPRLGVKTKIPGIGGFGIMIAQTPLVWPNLSTDTAWHGLFDRIVLLSCSVAMTHPKLKGGKGDGKRFCAKLAEVTGATVFGADVVQIYNHNPTGIDFGPFEGNLYRFEPGEDPVRIRASDGNVRTRFTREKNIFERMGDFDAWLSGN